MCSADAGVCHTWKATGGISKTKGVFHSGVWAVRVQVVALHPGPQLRPLQLTAGLKHRQDSHSTAQVFSRQPTATKVVSCGQVPVRK